MDGGGEAITPDPTGRRRAWVDGSHRASKQSGRISKNRTQYMTTALTVRDGNPVSFFDSCNDPLGAVEKLGDWMAKSGLFGCEKAEQGRVLAMICMTERKSPTAILRTYHLVGGKLSKKAMAAFAEFRRAGGKVRWIQTGDEPGAKEASAVFSWEGNDTTWSYSLDDATRAGLVRPNSGWVLRPGNMLRSKVISNALGALAPEIFAGEDESDIPDRPAPTITLDIPKTVTTWKPEDDGDLGPTGDVTVVIPYEPPTAPVVTHCEPNPTVEPPAKQDAPQAKRDNVSQITELLGDNIDLAYAWMIRHGWLKDGETLDKLSATNQARIIKQAATFIRAIQPVS